MVALPHPEIRTDTRRVSPRSCDDLIKWKSTFSEEVAEADLGPSGAVGGVPVDPDQERQRDQEMAAGAEHVEDVLRTPVGPKNMLEHLLGDHQIELPLGRLSANVELGKVEGRVRLEGAAVAPEASRDLGDVEASGGKLQNEFQRLPVHYDPDPLLVAESEEFGERHHPGAHRRAGEECGKSGLPGALRERPDDVGRDGGRSGHAVLGFSWAFPGVEA